MSLTVVNPKSPWTVLQLHPDRAQLVAVGFAALLNLHRVTHVNLVAAARVVIDKVKFVDTGPHRVIRRGDDSQIERGESEERR